MQLLCQFAHEKLAQVVCHAALVSVCLLKVVCHAALVSVCLLKVSKSGV